MHLAFLPMWCPLPAVDFIMRDYTSSKNNLKQTVDPKIKNKAMNQKDIMHHFHTQIAIHLQGLIQKLLKSMVVFPLASMSFGSDSE